MRLSLAVILMGSDKISSFRQRKTGNFSSNHRSAGEQQLLNKYL